MMLSLVDKFQPGILFILLVGLIRHLYHLGLKNIITPLPVPPIAQWIILELSQLMMNQSHQNGD